MSFGSVSVANLLGFEVTEDLWEVSALALTAVEHCLFVLAWRFRACLPAYQLCDLESSGEERGKNTVHLMMLVSRSSTRATAEASEKSLLIYQEIF